MKSLLDIYPGSIVSDELCVKEDCLCFFDENSQRYISIPKTEISEKETLLLQSFLTPADEVNQMSLKSPEENKWFAFLFSKGEVPANIKKRTRFVHFHLIGKMERASFAEAVRHFWPVPFVIVWMHEDRGVSLKFLRVISTSVSVFMPGDFMSRMRICEHITPVNRRISCLLKNGCLRCRV